jgi:hypothetical protein
VVERLGRLFDAVSALAGVAVLVILGPGMLISAVTARVPEVGELTRLDGITVACRAVIRGAALRLEGYQREFHSQLDSCSKALAEPAHVVHVSVYVASADLNSRQRRAPIPSFGFMAQGEVVHELDADLSAARLDRVVLSGTGVLGTAVLIWLGWVVVGRRDTRARLLTAAPATR